jgi:chromosome segregation ATPase
MPGTNWEISRAIYADHRSKGQIRYTQRRKLGHMTIDEKLESLHDSIKGLETIATAHQSTIEAHDRQIEALLKISEENARNWEQLRREWQAYLNTLPRH